MKLNSLSTHTHAQFYCEKVGGSQAQATIMNEFDPMDSTP